LFTALGPVANVVASLSASTRLVDSLLARAAPLDARL